LLPLSLLQPNILPRVMQSSNGHTGGGGGNSGSMAMPSVFRASKLNTYRDYDSSSDDEGAGLFRKPYTDEPAVHKSKGK